MLEFKLSYICNIIYYNSEHIFGVVLCNNIYYLYRNIENVFVGKKKKDFLNGTTVSFFFSSNEQCYNNSMLKFRIYVYTA
jgi:hypothetical protein